ncbi:carboxypeptidase regulatory-like domain-containing protein [Paenibacillus sp. RC67]|uniref:carboxypeptidase regulatory-like domain-containing protein n=1 Tax=Paenibacillus sp. RC67 TaxID=3039392 RepID=UPI0024AE8361|nr:carboxypeptidase regulatory-like domain-containing protein [Paenibacillus sp. RC67]
MKYRSTRKLTALILSLCLFISSFGIAFGAENASDVKGHWAEKQLTRWLAKNWIQGYEDGSFKPDSSITRAEFMALANRSFELKTMGSVSFTDLKSTDWNYNDVMKALGAGYIEGYEDHTIRSANKINREEAVVIISRLLKLDSSTTVSTGFKDEAQISAWSQSAVTAAVAKKIVDGYADKTFQPKKEITRAEAVVMLDRALPAQDNNVVYSQEGTYGPSSGSATLNGNVVIDAPGIKLQNTVIEGDLLLASSIKEGEVYLSNVTVKGTTTINGGGSNSVHIMNSVLNKIVIDKKNGIVRVVLEGTTTVQEVTVQTKAIIETASGTVIQLVIANEVIEVTGQGTLNSVTLNGPAKGSTFEKQPGKLDGEGASAASATGGTGGSSRGSSNSQYSQMGTVSGYVYDYRLSQDQAANKGIAGVTVSVYSGTIATGTFVTSVTTDSDGKFNVSLTPGTYSLAYKATGYLAASRGNITVTAGQAVQADPVELAHNTLFVRVRDNTSGSQQRVFGAVVTVTINNQTFTEESNVDGAILFDLPVGTGTVRVTADGYEDATSATFEIKSGENTTVTVFMVPKTTTISGVVYDYATGVKQSGVTVAVYQMTSTSEKLVNTFITDDNGSYIATLKPWMHYRLQFTKPGYALGDTPIYVNIRPSAYTYDRAMANTVIYGNVTNSSSSSLAGVRITAVGQATYSTETDAYGNYKLLNLPAGSHVLTAFKEGYDSVTTSAYELTTEGTVRPTIRLTAIEAN